MVDPDLLEKVVRLSPDDRRELFEAAQETLAPDLADLIDRREKTAAAEPGSGREWDELRSDLREQYGR